jgi:hypothetical protein
MTSPEEIERQHTLRTAVARYEELRAREVLADSAGDVSPDVADGERLPADEVLELLALSEVIARKAGYGQQLAVRTARAAGASWASIARALGMSKQAAWEAHTAGSTRRATCTGRAATRVSTPRRSPGCDGWQARRMTNRRREPGPRGHFPSRYLNAKVSP